MCTKVLGFDVMLDDEYLPWLIEVNHSPSMAIAGNEEEEVHRDPEARVTACVTARAPACTREGVRRREKA